MAPAVAIDQPVKSITALSFGGTTNFLGSSARIHELRPQNGSYHNRLHGEDKDKVGDHRGQQDTECAHGSYPVNREPQVNDGGHHGKNSLLLHAAGRCH